MDMETAKRVMVGIREALVSEDSIRSLHCDLLFVDDQGRTLRMQATGKPEAHIMDVRINGKWEAAFSNSEI